MRWYEEGSTHSISGARAQVVHRGWSPVGDTHTKATVGDGKPEKVGLCTINGKRCYLASLWQAEGLSGHTAVTRGPRDERTGTPLVGTYLGSALS